MGGLQSQERKSPGSHRREEFEPEGREVGSAAELDVWWPVALSEQVRRRPVACQLDGAEVVLFRDASGSVRAVEDRCRHRRVPLSLGWVTEDGALQCGYHGWCYDGMSGALVRVPNYLPEQRVPRVSLITYPARESHGFVHLRTSAANSPPPDEPASPPVAVAMSRATGSVELPLSHAEVVAAVLANPVAALGGGDAAVPVGPTRVEVAGTGSDSTASSDGRTVRTSRDARRGHSPIGSLLFGPFASRLCIRTESWPTTGLTALIVEARGHRVLQALLAPIPLAAERTVLRWRLSCHGHPFAAGREHALALAGALRARRDTSARRPVQVTWGASEAFDAWAALTPWPEPDQRLRAGDPR